MHERSALASLAFGLTGFGAGVAAFAGSTPALGLVGGLCALGAAGFAWLADDEGTRPRRLSLHHPSRRTDHADGGPGAGGAATRSSTAPGARTAGPGTEGPGSARTGTAGIGASAGRDGGAEGVAIEHDPPAPPGAADQGSTGAGGRGPNRTSRALDGELLVDPLTGLYSESYLLVALDARIAAARRRLRPVSVVMVEVVRGLADGLPQPAEPSMVADALRSTLREADTASRMNDGRFALVLEDTPENGAIWTVERLRTCLLDAHPDHTVWAGVACYPAHAFNLDEIVAQSSTALEAAKEWRQDRIEVATAD